LTNAAPPAQQAPGTVTTEQSDSALPDDPGQEILPEAKPEPAPQLGTPVDWEAQRQQWAGDTVTLTGNVVLHYNDYVLTADKVTYNRATTELEAEGHLRLAGGPNDILVNASHGEMRLDMHTARFYDVHGSQGVRTSGRTIVYSTPNPLLYSGRVLIQTSEGSYRLIDGSMTNCRLPTPNWRIISHAIEMANGRASTSNSLFELHNIPVFYLPFLRHAVDDGDRESGLLIPVISNGSSIRGYTFGEQVYWVINRSADMIIGSEYYSKRGWAPNGDFRYKGRGLDHAIVRWNALLDRGIEQEIGNTLARTAAVRPADHLPSPVDEELVNQGGVDIAAEGRWDLSPNTRASGTAEYLSRYVYRLVFDDNYAQAISSQVSSDVALTHARNGLVPSVAFDRFETFAGTGNGDEVRILHLPNLRYDVLDRPLSSSGVSWGLGSSLNYLNRSEPIFHARNVGRFDFYPHMILPIHAGGWSVLAEGALRDTSYSISQTPDLLDLHHGIPSISHEPLNRSDLEASLDVRPPAVERDFALPFGHRVLRHVIEPELNYRYIGGIGAQAQNVLLFDTADIVTDTNEAGYSLTQRFYIRPAAAKPCEALNSASSDSTKPDSTGSEDQATKDCPAKPREWASWQIAQDFYINPDFGSALISGRRNIFESTLELTGIAFLTAPRNVSPVVSRMRFEAIDNLRIEWDMDYDPKRGQMDANNLFAGYSWGRTTIGLGHSLLNAVDEQHGSATTLKTQQVQPFLEIGKRTHGGLNLAVNGGYEFDSHTLQYAGVEAVYNWDCCGLTVGYRRFELGTVDEVGRDEAQWLYSFTLANFGNVGDIRRSNSVFRDPNLPSAY
jgi:LPS-assembly protein